MPFNHQVVRDLAWCCSSTPLLVDVPDQHISIWPTDAMYDERWLADLDQAPQVLIDELSQLKSTRLGIYYEGLWRFYWQHHPRYRLLAHNLQIVEQGQTLGAFDFIVQDGETIWHSEAAVKFYLGLPGQTQPFSEWSHWIGPNCNDRLDIKVERMLEHQLPLRFHPASQSALAALVTGENWHSALCLQGYLFYPTHQAMPAPRHAHPHHLRGYWWYLSQFDAAATYYWLVLPRHQWLSPARTADIHALLSRDQLRDYLQHWVGDRDRPQLIAAVSKQDDAWEEKLRGFVVPDHWPWTDTPSRNT